MKINESRGLLFIISSPSGGGKTSLVREVVKLSKHKDNVNIQISYTSRKKRLTEEDGVDYHFVSREKFSELVTQNFFIEYAEVFGNMYGVPTNGIDGTIKTNKDTILILEHQGYVKIKTLFKERVVGVFVLPKSDDTLFERLKTRNTESEESLNRRISEAKAQIETAIEYDYVIVNDILEKAVSELSCILTAEKLRCTRLIEVS